MMTTSNLLSLLQTEERLLRPATFIRRFRPIRLATVAYELAIARRKARALELVNRFFPDRFGQLDTGDDWLEVFRFFLGLVEEAGWFKIDWSELDDLYRLALETWGENDDEQEPGALGMLAEYLWQIPVERYGFQDEEVIFYTEIYPCIGLLAQLQGYLPAEAADFVDDYDLSDNNLLGRISETLAGGNFGQYSEPLCWLPEICAIAISETGNIILDTTNRPLYAFDYPDDQPTWSWDQPVDLNALRAAWREAEPAVKRLQQYIEWCRGEEEMVRVVRCLAGEMEQDHDPA